MPELEPNFYVVKQFEKINYLNDKILVHWKGYDCEDEFTWEPRKNLVHDLGKKIFDSLMQGLRKRGKDKQDK